MKEETSGRVGEELVIDPKELLAEGSRNSRTKLNDPTLQSLSQIDREVTGWGSMCGERECPHPSFLVCTVGGIACTTPGLWMGWGGHGWLCPTKGKENWVGMERAWGWSCAQRGSLPWRGCLGAQLCDWIPSTTAQWVTLGERTALLLPTISPIKATQRKLRFTVNLERTDEFAPGHGLGLLPILRALVQSQTPQTHKGHLVGSQIYLSEP